MGSEMCIRDRDVTARRVFADQAEGIVCTKREVKQIRYFFGESHEVELHLTKNSV